MLSKVMPCICLTMGLSERIDINIRKILTMGNLYFFKKETNKNTKETDKKQ